MLKVRDESLINVYQSDCGLAGVFTVSDVFDLFDDFVGTEPIPPVASNPCMYYHVTVYPHHLKNHFVSVPTRGLYFSFEQLIAAHAYLTIGPPELTAMI